MKEFRIFGPPGTGKTTRLVHQSIPAAIERFGPDRVMVSSFTRAAAIEIADRLKDQGSEIDLQNVGTLHAICYRALGRPELVSGHMKEWNEFNPDEAVSGDIVSDVDEGGSIEAAAINGRGDKTLAKVQILRAKMVPEHLWPLSCQAFYTKWKEWKKESGYLDFTDLIELAKKELFYAPNNPQVLFVDEAQDSTPQMLDLCRRWGAMMPWFVFCGDDDQTLYQFTGASPDAFLDPPVEDKYKTVLAQSFRVPKAAYQVAQGMIARVQRRETKEYAPTDEPGFVSMLSTTNFKRPEELVPRINRLTDAGESVMILASCSFMLGETIKMLRAYGIPFHNPYRRTRGDWNPLAARGKGVSTSFALRTFVGASERVWTVPEMLTWAKCLRVGDAGIAPRTGNKAIKALEAAVERQEEGLESCEEVLGHVVGPAGVEAALNRNLDWFIDNLKPDRRQRAEFPLAIYRRGGIKKLSETPKVIVGTIHSVKGGEADNVVLFPDLSSGAVDEAEYNLETRDSHKRMFYVGLTRTKKGLFLCHTVQNPFSRRPQLKMYEDW